MKGLKPHLEIAVASIRAFADDGTLDVAEIDALVAIALRDGAVDDDERRVLARVFREARAGRLGVEARAALDAVAARHGLAD